MRHHHHKTLVEETGVAETAVDKSVAPVDTLTNREAWIAADPTGERRRVHDAQIAEFREKFSALTTGLKPILHGIVDKAEQLRQVGIVMVEFCETVPGGKFTRDIYEQHKHEFTDAHGQSVDFELLEWSIRVARDNHDPITTLHVALKWRQPLLLATGDTEFVLESVPPPQKSVPPPDPLATVQKLLDTSALSEALSKLRSNPNYYPGGQLREGLKETLAEQLRPTFALVDDLRRELGI